MGERENPMPSMPEESMPFLSEELVEQDGPNMGCISDVDLAWEAALVEDEIRSQKIRNILGRVFNSVFRNYDIEEYKLYRSDNATEKVMEEEVERRATDALKHKNISEKGKRIAISDAALSFTNDLQDKRDRRIDMEVEATKTEEQSERRAKREKEKDAKERKRRIEEQRKRINKIFPI